MPTFTTIALENLLEHRNPSTNSSTLKSQQPSTNKPNYLQNHVEQNDEAKEEEKFKARKRLNHIYISPALYTTPEPTPILDYSSSGSVSSSPYVFNRKGRGGGNSANRRVDGFEVQGSGAQSVGNEAETLLDGKDELVESSLIGGGGENGNRGEVEGEGADDDDEDFVDPRCDSFSVASSSDLNDSGRLGLENMSVISNQIGEFYDAIEDFSSDGSIMSLASCSRNLESELHTTGITLIEEIEKRKIAEHELATMHTQWQKISKILLSQTGFTFLEAPSSEGGCMQFDINEMKQFSQEVVYARFVAEAMAKAEAQAEAELAAEVVIGSKDKEISRLKDRLQYYEAMIHEMSQKNLESMEVARRQREKKKGHRKWLWSCIGMSIVIGASVIAYSYAPPTTTTTNTAESESGHD
ncbi:unnamed protein product [Lactuca virosa]|uniref:Uncharacterized protein n=1 Tax=Lactuca virosa TaxID=75947 RepID=A0AAU9P2G1_9ASTR|nr:unnamed protein product [Lactuca virosa]